MRNIYVVLFAFILLGSTGALAQGGWTSIAYNAANGAWGESHGYNDLSDAEIAASDACGDGCGIIAWANNGYVALATGDNGWGTGGLHDSLQDAINSSIQECSTVAMNCNWVVWASAFDNGPAQTGVNNACQKN